MNKLLYDTQIPPRWIIDKTITHIFRYTSIENIYRCDYKIPIDSYTRTWVEPDGTPYKYEFRGKSYIGYYNPQDLLIIK